MVCGLLGLMSLQGMDTAWPDVAPRSKPPCWFRNHEWVKHGTCAPNFFADQNDYYTKTLAVFNLLDLVGVLAKEEINPSVDKLVSISKMTSVLAARWGGKPVIGCQKVRGFDDPTIQEIRFCMDTQMKPMNCPDKYSDKLCGSNPKTLAVFIPAWKDERDEDEGPMFYVTIDGRTVRM